MNHKLVVSCEKRKGEEKKKKKGFQDPISSELYYKNDRNSGRRANRLSDFAVRSCARTVGRIVRRGERDFFHVSAFLFF